MDRDLPAAEDLSSLCPERLFRGDRGRSIVRMPGLRSPTRRIVRYVENEDRHHLAGAVTHSLLRQPRLAQTVEAPLVVSDPRRIVGQRQLLRSELGNTLGGDAGESQIALQCFMGFGLAVNGGEQQFCEYRAGAYPPKPFDRLIILLLHEEGPRLKSCRLPSQRCRAILWFGSTPGAPASNLCRGRNSPAARTAWPRSNWPRQSPPRPGRLSKSPATAD